MKIKFFKSSANYLVVIIGLNLFLSWFLDSNLFWFSGIVSVVLGILSLGSWKHLSYIIVLAISLTSILLLFDPVARLFLNQNGYRILLLLSINYLVSYYIYRQKLYVKRNGQEIFNLNIFILISILFFTNLLPIRNNSEALEFIFSSGEDNAAWLTGISTSILSGGSFSSQLLESSGYPQALQIFLVQNLHLVGLSTPPLVVESAQILYKSYFFLFFLFLIGFIVQIPGVLQTRATLLTFSMNFFVKFSTALVAWKLATVFLSLGHLSALVSVTLFIFALGLLSGVNDENGIGSTIGVIAQISIFLAAGQVWTPMHLPSVIIALGIAIKFLLHSRDLKLFKLHNVVFKAFEIFVALLLAFLSLQAISRFRNYDFSKFASVLHLQGGSYDLLGTPGLVLISTFLILLIYSKSLSVNNRIFTAVLIFLVAYLIVIIFASMISPPHTLDYAAKKLSLYVGIVLFVFVLNLAYQKINVLVDSTLKMQLFTVAMIFFTLVFIPGPGYSYPQIQLDSNVPWAKTAVKELQSSPDRKIICLNTANVESAASFEMYACNRILTALQATEDKRITGWAMASLTDNWEALKSIPIDSSDLFYSKLTVLVTDSSRNSTYSESQMEFLSKFPFDKVKIVQIGN